MPEILFVSRRGQITLPASIRKKYGIRGGSALVLVEGNNELLLKPAVTMESEIYSDRQIAEWDRADNLDVGERADLIRKFGKRK